MYWRDLEEREWEVMKKMLKVEERKGKYDLGEIWNGILYVVKRGWEWGMVG